MSHPNEKLLRTAYEAFGGGDLNPLMDSLTDDIMWHVSGRSPLAGEYAGKPQVLGLFGKMMELYRGTLRLQVLNILANEGHGIVMTREWAQHDGKALEFRAIHVWGVREGRLAQFQVYYDDAYHKFWS